MQQLEIATSYFYQIRFFKPYMIPVSTAVFDPKWYHNFKGQDHVFIDKRGVVNGLRIKSLMPDHTCNNLCRGFETCLTKDPGTCDFLKAYSRQLDTIDVADFMDRLSDNIERLVIQMDLRHKPLVVFMVHEAFGKECSERGAILNWLHKVGVDADELYYPIEGNY